MFDATLCETHYCYKFNLYIKLIQESILRVNPRSIQKQKYYKKVQ